MKRLGVAAGSMAAALMALTGIVISGQAREAAAVSAKFTHPLTIDNPYSPLVAGTTYIYDGTTGHHASHETFVVTNNTKTVKGIQTRVVHDTDYENGKLVEDTFDWFAQDDAGNVWYFGEDSAQYKNGKVVGHAGSWQAGVNGASEGIVMQAKPQAGVTYAQENAPGVANDMATVVSLNQSVCVPYGCFTNVLQTRESSPLEPGVLEVKYYARGVGEIKAVMTQGGTEQSTLTTVKK